MVKTRIIETTEKFDKDGKLAERIVREETSEDNANYFPRCDLKIDGESIIKSVADGIRSCQEGNGMIGGDRTWRDSTGTSSTR